MELTLQAEISATIVFLLVILIYQTKQDSIGMKDEKIFHILLSVTLLSVIADFAFWAIDGKVFSGAWILLTLDSLISFLTCVLIPYVWLIYVDYRIFQNENRLKKRIIWYSIPLALFLVVLLATPFTGWLFHVTKDSVYTRGSLYFVQVVISYVYMIFTSALALKAALHCDLATERKDYYSLACFIIIPFVGGLFQAFIFGLTTVSITITLSELMIYINVQNKHLSLDALTQINNRGYLNRYIDSRTKAERKDQNLYMLLLDINHFKEINDTYGHKEGDLAIINMANILKDSCNRYRCFLARYGGDEFAIVHECKSDETIKEIIQQIHQSVNHYNQFAGKPYQLSLSIGYARYDGEAVTAIENMLEEADNYMYTNKKKASGNSF